MGERGRSAEEEGEPRAGRARVRVSRNVGQLKLLIPCKVYGFH